MRKLHRTLHGGSVVDPNGPTTDKGPLKTPIGGDILKLPYAHGLTEMERNLARKLLVVASQMPGTPYIRKLMLHAFYGARIFYGDTLFVTLSPNPHHSSFVLQLSRARRCDPGIKGPDEVDRIIENNCRWEDSSASP